MVLIDCLQKYEGQTITLNHLAGVYPEGFYDEKSFGTYVDKYIKTRKAKWSKIY